MAGTKRPLRTPFSNAKRIRALERKMRLANKEVRSKTFAGSTPIALSSSTFLRLSNVQIDDTVSGRNGNKIKILRAEIHIESGLNIETFLLQGRGVDTPVFTDVEAVAGGHVKSSVGRVFYPWDHRWQGRDDYTAAGSQIVRYSINRKFKTGWSCEFVSGTATEACDKNLFLYFVNKNGIESESVSWSAKIWFVDA